MHDARHLPWKPFFAHLVGFPGRTLFPNTCFAHLDFRSPAGGRRERAHQQRSLRARRVAGGGSGHISRVDLSERGGWRAARRTAARGVLFRIAAALLRERSAVCRRRGVGGLRVDERGVGEGRRVRSVVSRCSRHGRGLGSCRGHRGTRQQRERTQRDAHRRHAPRRPTGPAGPRRVRGAHVTRCDSSRSTGRPGVSPAPEDAFVGPEEEVVIVQ